MHVGRSRMSGREAAQTCEEVSTCEHLTWAVEAQVANLRLSEALRAGAKGIRVRRRGALLLLCGRRCALSVEIESPKGGQYPEIGVRSMDA